MTAMAFDFFACVQRRNRRPRSRHGWPSRRHQYRRSRPLRHYRHRSRSPEVSSATPSLKSLAKKPASFAPASPPSPCPSILRPIRCSASAWPRSARAPSAPPATCLRSRPVLPRWFKAQRWGPRFQLKCPGQGGGDRLASGRPPSAPQSRARHHRRRGTRRAGLPHHPGKHRPRYAPNLLAGPLPALCRHLQRPEIILDVAHNPAGAWALRAALSRTVGRAPDGAALRSHG